MAVRVLVRSCPAWACAAFLRGDSSYAAAMNMWLHKQVMRKLAENGGKVPDELRS